MQLINWSEVANMAPNKPKNSCNCKHHRHKRNLSHNSKTTGKASAAILTDGKDKFFETLPGGFIPKVRNNLPETIDERPFFSANIQKFLDKGKSLCLFLFFIQL